MDRTTDDMETDWDSITKMQRLFYIQRKKDFQERLVNYYRRHMLEVTVFPLQSERYQTDISDVYFPPRLTVELQTGIRISKKTREMRIHEILENDDKFLKSIYILGEAGSGKTALCKRIVGHWCRAHENGEFNTSESEEVKEMADYDFLFYISLQHSSDCKSIRLMLEKYFKDPILNKVLENEADRCLIILDGLDEWKPIKPNSSQFQTLGLPIREVLKNYTTITLSRPWKFEALDVRDSEISELIQLKGINENLARAFIENTLKSLKHSMEASVAAADFEADFQTFPLSVLTQMPMFMQSLICSWYEGKLKGASKCAIYSNMLEMFFKWHDIKLMECQNERKTEMEEADISFQLPDFLRRFETLLNYKNVIGKLSSLAFDTLHASMSEHSYKFTSSTLEDVNITGAIKKFCLEVGILLLDRSLPMLASAGTHSSYSFVNKSVQEYLAAVHLAAKLKKILKFSEEKSVSGTCRENILQIFGNSKTTYDILQMSNVLSILCGLEPRLTEYITDYIYNTAATDSRVIESRTLLDSDLKLISEIQRSTLDCFKEDRAIGHHSRIYLGDIVIKSEVGTDDIAECLQEQVIVPEYVRSLYISETSERFTGHTLNSLANCESLTVLVYDRYEIFSESGKMDEIIFKILKNNTSCKVLSLSLKQLDYLRTELPFVHCLPAMQQLSSLDITSTYLTHDACIFLSTWLCRATQLHRISLDIDCFSGDQHIIDLTNHDGLTSIDIKYCSLFVTNFSTKSLETCRLSTNTTALLNHVCNTLNRASALQLLELGGNSCTSTDYAANSAISRNMTRLLPLLTSLRTLRLQGFTFTSNIMHDAANMETLEQLYIYNICMPFLVWFKFIDSLSVLKQSVKVTTRGLYVTPIRAGPVQRRVEYWQEGTARQYIMRKMQSFNVTLDNPPVVVFITNKAEA